MLQGKVGESKTMRLNPHTDHNVSDVSGPLSLCSLGRPMGCDMSLGGTRHLFSLHLSVISASVSSVLKPGGRSQQY